MPLNSAEIPDPGPEFENKILHWLRSRPMAAVLNGNNYINYPEKPFRKRMAAGNTRIDCVESWQNTLKNKPGDAWWFGYLGFELQGSQAGDERPVFLDFPEWSFFEADAVFEWKDGNLVVHAAAPLQILEEINRQKPEINPVLSEVLPFRPFYTRENYLDAAERVRHLIREGDVYELNLCQYFESFSAPDGQYIYHKLNGRFPMPFSAWYKSEHLEIACASPERFLKRQGNKIISQPIKGTARRGATAAEDQANRAALLNSEKERAENMMIVDLVRNDLARVSKTGSTRVDELFGIYAFPHVFQMISTVCSEPDEGVDNAGLLQSAFPMGSMTGAPKQEVLKQTMMLEPLRRGAYSGALGCFEPGTDFDFNVLIRSLFINHHLGRCGLAAGSAITIDSNPEEEWKECMAKAASVLSVCGQTSGNLF